MNSTAEQSPAPDVKLTISAKLGAERSDAGRSPEPKAIGLDAKELAKREQVRGTLLAMQEMMERHPHAIPGDHPSLPIRNLFSNGIYVREIRIPKGMFVMGRIHKHEHPNILVQGSVMVLTETGVEKLTAPMHMVSPAGTKRFLYTREDTIWTTIHKTDATTQEEAEKDCVTDSYEEIGLMYRKVNGIGGIGCLLQ